MISLYYNNNDIDYDMQYDVINITMISCGVFEHTISKSVPVIDCLGIRHAETSMLGSMLVN